MNTRLTYVLIFLMGLFLFSCEGKKTNSDDKKEKTEEPAQAPGKPVTETKETVDTLKELQSLILPGYEILGHRYGDLNKDELTTDLILILKKSDEAETSDIDSPTLRPLLVFCRQKDGSLQQKARNDNTVLCVNCGGIFGDPYSGIAIKNGFFSVEHYGGSNWRWTKIITYRYHADSDNWRLHKIGEESYHTGNPDEVETTIQSVKDFGEVNFEAYRIYANI